MVTDYDFERVLLRSYPTSLKHLQQLLMDCEECAKSYGKRDWRGRDKLDLAMDKFFATVGVCINNLESDGHVTNRLVTLFTLKELNAAMLLCEIAYSNWPLSFKFWKDWYAQVVAKHDRDLAAGKE